MTSKTPSDDIIPFYKRLVFLWTNNETPKTQFGFQTKKILDTLGDALASVGDMRRFLMSQEYARFQSVSRELIERQSSGSITPRECLHEGLLLFFDCIPPRGEVYQNYHKECRIFGDQVVPESYDESSLILMLKRNRV